MLRNKINKSPLKFLFKYIVRHRISLAIGFFALITTSGGVLSFGVQIRHLVDQGVAVNDKVHLALSAMMMIVTAIIFAIGSYLRVRTVNNACDRIVADIRSDLYNHIIKLKAGFFDKRQAGEIVSCFLADTAALQSIMGNGVSFAIRNSLVLIGSVVFLFIINTKLTLIIFVLILFVITPVLLRSKKLRGLGNEAQNIVALISSSAFETIGNIKLVQIFCREANEASEMRKVLNRASALNNKRNKFRASIVATTLLLAFLAVTLLLWIGGADVMSGKITAGELSSFIFYAILSASALGALSETVNDFQTMTGIVTKLLLIYDQPQQLGDLKKEVVDYSKLEFCDISFGYSDESIIFKNLNFCVNNGEKLSIVGASGSGKSTILQLLLRLYEPITGEIKLGGININQLNLYSFRDLFSFVAAKPLLFSGTIFENLSYGNNKTRQEILEFLQSSQAFDFIMTMPDGLESDIGASGAALSSGEQQRISIARALLRDAKIFIFDEATSALDEENEKLIYDLIAKCVRDKIAIFVTHDLGRAIKMDRVIVLDNGQMIEK